MEPASVSDRVVLSALRVLPKNWMSRVAGRFAGLHLPRAVVRAEILAFARAYDIDLDEVRDPIDSFPSLQSFFTRALKDGARPVDPAPDALVSPCDGAWGAAGPIEQGACMQIKGRPYLASTLLVDDELAKRFDGGAFATWYLAPRDYHRFHTPCDGVVKKAVHVPGTLWPVNQRGVRHIDGLFATNERIIALLQPDGTDGLLAMVAVGATMVGKVRTTFDEHLVTNVRRSEPLLRDYGADAPRLKKGEEWGRFEFGSTIVLLATKGAVQLDVQEPGTPLRLGTRVGRLAGARAR
jgi:phosphatidylserine decarboxylase